MTLTDTIRRGGGCWQRQGRDSETGLLRMIHTICIRGCERGTCYSVGNDHICQMCSIKLCWDCFSGKAQKSQGLQTNSLTSVSYNSELMNLNRVTSMQLWLEKYNRVAIWINLWCQSQQDKMYKTCSMKTTWSSLSSSIKNQLSSSPVYTQLGQRTKPIFQCAAIKTIIRY